MTCLADRYLLPKALKLTTKYTETDKEHVRQCYNAGWTQRAIARTIPMSRRMVSFILFPEKLAINKAQFAVRQKTGKYRYSTEKQSRMVREVRQRKRKILSQLIKK